MAAQPEWSQTTIDSASLALRLRDTLDGDAWTRVSERYGPLVEAFARRLGLPPELAEDARQESLLAFAQAIREGQYDRTRGRLRDYLFGIARRKIFDALARDRRRGFAPGLQVSTGFFGRVPTEDDFVHAWHEQERAAVCAACLREARTHFSAATYLAFYHTAIEGQSSAAVAERLGKSVNAVDMATHHVREFLRQIEPQITDAF